MIVPAYNEAGVIAETLSHVNRAVEYLHGHTPHSASVLLVDNASSDRTAEIARASGAAVVREPERNIAAVRNAGARSATAGVLVFLDADTIVPETFLHRIVQVMADPDCVGGAVDTRYEPRRSLVRLYLMMWRMLGALTGAAQGAAQFCRRDFFFEVGGYDETLYMGEDVDFHWRMIRAARKRDRLCCLMKDIRVLPSCRRFDQWPFWRTLLWTNPLTAFFWRRRKAAWGAWYERPPR